MRLPSYHDLASSPEALIGTVVLTRERGDTACNLCPRERQHVPFACSIAIAFFNRE
jgi:hypothetical protein